MEPCEIMISESQERMVAHRLPGAPRATSRRSAASGSSTCAVIGEVTDIGRLRAFFDGELVGRDPRGLLTERGPALPRRGHARGARARRSRTGRPTPTPRTCSTLLASPNVAQPRPVYERSTTSSSGRAPCGARASTPPCCACGRRCAGSRSRSTAPGALGVARPARAAARSPCSRRRATSRAPAGGRSPSPTASTSATPRRPRSPGSSTEAIEGMALACEALGIPVVSGNVSLYNETDGRAIYPTPVVGCVGLVDDVRRVPATWREGDAVFARRRARAAPRRLRVPGALPRRPGRAAADARTWPPRPRSSASSGARRRSLTCAHDAAEGGLAVALAECAIAAGLGAEIELDGRRGRLFGEGGGQVVVIACPTEDVSTLLEGMPHRQARARRRRQAARRPARALCATRRCGGGA